jgi:hypothetical protein
LKQLFYVTNPNNIRAVEYLVKFHEERGDKIIVFSDFIYSLKLYARLFKKPLVYGETPERERAAILGTFRASDANRTIYISKAGDISIDLPKANVNFDWDVSCVPNYTPNKREIATASLLSSFVSSEHRHTGKCSILQNDNSF